MVRPRGAGFYYVEEDKKVMFKDAKALLKSNADGIAFGFLDEDKNIDIESMLVEYNNNVKQFLEKEEKILEKIEDAKKQEEYDNALALGKEIESKTLKINVKLGSNGKLFGTVTNKEIASALKEQSNIEIDKKKIILSSPIKTLGEKEVTVKLHPKVSVTLKIAINEQK